jgi:hypothetical protein
MRNLQAKINEIKDATKEAVNEVALDLIGKAKERAPLDTGDLRGSGFVNNGGTNGQIYKAKVGFSEPYALEQHENLQYQHPRGGEAKYLENPLKENEERYIDHIKSKVRRVIQ